VPAILVPICLVLGVIWGPARSRQKPRRLQKGSRVYQRKFGYGTFEGFSPNRRKRVVRFGDGNEREAPFSQAKLC
jgi:hypothetical protein